MVLFGLNKALHVTLNIAYIQIFVLKWFQKGNF